MSVYSMFIHQVFPTSPQHQQGQVPRRIHVSVYNVYISTPSVPNITTATARTSAKEDTCECLQYVYTPSVPNITTAPARMSAEEDTCECLQYVYTPSVPNITTATARTSAEEDTCECLQCVYKYTKCSQHHHSNSKNECRGGYM